jgi:hypothetical protein
MLSGSPMMLSVNRQQTRFLATQTGVEEIYCGGAICSSQSRNHE